MRICINLKKYSIQNQKPLHATCTDFEMDSLLDRNMRGDTVAIESQLHCKETSKGISSEIFPEVTVLGTFKKYNTLRIKAISPLPCK